MYTKRSTLLVLFLLPLFTKAQDLIVAQRLNEAAFYGPAYFENTQDSADFAQFRNGLQRVDPTMTKDTTMFECHMVWRESEHGGITMITRGDGSLQKLSERSALSPYELMINPYSTPDGRRVMVLIHEVPCALICRSTWYYVEE